MFGGFGVAYDAVKATVAAQARSEELHSLNHMRKHRRYGNQMLTYIMERKEQLKLLDSIETQLTADSQRKSERNCPECGSSFILIDADGVEIETCLQCGSFWFDPGELGALTHRRSDIPGEKEEPGPSRFKCPVCATQMQEHRFRTHQDLLVDRCPANHGVYLERNELERAIDLTTALKLNRPGKVQAKDQQKNDR